MDGVCRLYRLLPVALMTRAMICVDGRVSGGVEVISAAAWRLRRAALLRGAMDAGLWRVVNCFNSLDPEASFLYKNIFYIFFISF